MTHGCGSLSTTSGGCGGFSGSAYSATSAAVIAASASSRAGTRRTNNGQTDEDCVDCCVCSAKGIAFLFSLLFCIRDVTKQTRIMVTWFWALLFSVSLSFIFGLGLYGAKEFAAAPSDMRIIDQSYSTFICDSFIVRPSHKSNIYLMPDTPPIEEKRRRSYNMTANMFVSGGTYEYWGFYLLTGSSVTARSCSTGYSTLYVIRGKNNLKEWISDNSCSSCVIYTQHLPAKVFCLGSSDYVTYRLNLLTSDDVYFVYSVSDYTSSPNIRARFELEKTSYNVSSALEVKYQAREAFFELAYDSSEVIIYEIIPGLEQDLTVSVETHCYPRVILYMAFFVLPPLFTGLLVTYCILKTCKNPAQSSAVRARGRSRPRNQGPRTPLLSAQYSPVQQPSATLPPYSQQDELPPKYETVEHTKNAPPSYEESLNVSS